VNENMRARLLLFFVGFPLLILSLFFSSICELYSYFGNSPHCAIPFIQRIAKHADQSQFAGHRRLSNFHWINSISLDIYIVYTIWISPGDRICLIYFLVILLNASVNPACIPKKEFFPRSYQASSINRACPLLYSASSGISHIHCFRIS